MNVDRPSSAHRTDVLSFKSDRKFTLFGYTCSHGLLLLRSGKTNEHSTRIDVLITDVRAMEIRSWSEGLEIAQANQDYLDGFQSNPIEMSQPGNNIYALKGTGWQGFVVGGILSVCEDELDFGAPSALTSDTRFGSSLSWER